MPDKNCMHRAGVQGGLEINASRTGWLNPGVRSETAILRRRLLQVGGLLLVIAVSVVVVALGFQIYRAQYCERLLGKIDKLALSPPPNVSELEWAAIVFWTHNLHCNSIPQVYANLSTLRTIDNLIEAASEQPDRQKINRLWDEYAKVSQSGFRYRQKYMLVRDEIAEAIAIQGNSFSDFRSYNDFLVSILARHSSKQ